jgi:hypothetical protein
MDSIILLEERLETFSENEFENFQPLSPSALKRD